MKKHLIRTSLFTCLAILSLNLSGQKAEEKVLIINKIKLQDQKLVAFLKASKSDSIAAMFSPNCHFAREFGPIVESREEVLTIYKKDFKEGMKIVSCKFDALEYKVYDDIVMEIGTNTVEFSKGPDKKLYRQVQNYIFIWKESKTGNYQIRAAFWNSQKNPCGS